MNPDDHGALHLIIRDAPSCNKYVHWSAAHALIKSKESPFPLLPFPTCRYSHLCLSISLSQINNVCLKSLHAVIPSHVMNLIISHSAERVLPSDELVLLSMHLIILHS